MTLTTKDWRSRNTSLLVYATATIKIDKHIVRIQAEKKTEKKSACLHQQEKMTPNTVIYS